MKKVPARRNVSNLVAKTALEASYSEGGVDLTLIRWMLSLTPTERLDVLQQSVRSLARLCNEGSLT